MVQDQRSIRDRRGDDSAQIGAELLDGCVRGLAEARAAVPALIPAHAAVAGRYHGAALVDPGTQRQAVAVREDHGGAALETGRFVDFDVQEHPVIAAHGELSIGRPLERPVCTDVDALDAIEAAPVDGRPAGQGSGRGGGAGDRREPDGRGSDPTTGHQAPPVR